MCEKSEKVNNSPWKLALLVLCDFLRLQERSPPARTTKNQDFEPAYVGFVPVASGFSLKAFRV